MNMNVKQAAERSGVSSRNIRYYEQAGLLSPARDPGNDYRVYSEADVHALKLIRMLRTLDMPIEEIHAVLDGSTPLPQAAARQRERLEARQAKLAAASAFCGQLAADGTEAGTGRGCLPGPDGHPRAARRMVYRLGRGLPQGIRRRA